MSNQVTLNKREEYRTEVNNYGGAKPKFRGKNKNVIDFEWDKISTDGKGNVLSMPLLPDKECFGKVEYVLRHGTKSPEPKPIKGRMIDIETRCTRCLKKTPNTHASCNSLVRERITQNPKIELALKEWHADVKIQKQNPNRYDPIHTDPTRKFVGDILGAKWTAFKIAIIDHGRFTNANDEELKHEFERTEIARRREDARRQRLARELKRAELKMQGRPPSKEFQEAAWMTCKLRTEQLKLARKIPGISFKISKMTDSGCELVSYAWYYKLFCEQMGKPCKAGSMARWLIDEGMCGNRSYATLKSRLGDDIKKAEMIDAAVYGDIWPEFDPDYDLQIPVK